MPDCREVNPAEARRRPFRAEPLFLTNPPSGTPGWSRTRRPTRPSAGSELGTDPDLRKSRELTDQPRSLSVLVSESPDPSARGAAPTARVAVYGSGAVLRRPGAGPPAEPVPRPSCSPPPWTGCATGRWSNIANKTYGQYTPKPEPDSARLLYLPVGITLLGVLAVGFGMWVFRQK